MNFGTEVVLIELIGVVAFALSGVIIALKKHFDLFGIIVLGVITAVGGGVIRDIILGILPPAMFKNSLYVSVAFITTIMAFIITSLMKKYILQKEHILIELINVFDAVGLGIFSITGTNAAIMSGYANNAFLAIFVGVMTGIGGGILRDLLANRSPFVLYKDIYASAAIVGSSLYYVFYISSINKTVAITSTIFITIFIRMLATYFHLELPKIKFKDKNF